MAENIAAEILRPVIEDGVKGVGATIIRQFNYLCCFTSNIATLKDEARALDDEAKGLQGRVDGARNDAQIIIPPVETWITKSEAINAEMNEILNEVPNVGSGCLKLKSRFSLSKRAKKTTDCMKELRDQCKFHVISHPRPLAATEAVLLGTTYEFQSRKQIEEDIMTSLRDGDVNMIGICGMGGLGKTTMAKMIMKRALKEHVFEEVVMAVVSQPADKFKIQLEIGGSLHLDLKDETSEASRVQKLRARLSGTKRILLVLDDIWESLKVEDIGIPRGCKGCTILLTSRNHHVLSAMDVKVFGMQVLSEEEAWFLFRGRAGICVDDTGLNSIAKEIVKECRGLPIALTTVGSALKDEKNKGIWKDAVRQLRKANPTNIPDYIKDVFNPLKVSYDWLDSEEAKSVFLLCCLFDEDVNIPVEKLTYFCMGLGVFEGGMEEARNRMHTLIKMLKSRSLLLDGCNEVHVKMHDVVHDVCIFIAKEEGYIGHNDCTWLSSSFQLGGGRSKLPTNLRLLFLTSNSELQEEIKFDKSFVEGNKDLQVLCIEKYSFTSLPHTTTSLKNLNTLLLYSCSELDTLSAIGELLNLEILICRDCDSIKELPPEIKELNHLKLLDLTGCRNLERIGGGIISSLVGLEELKMFNSFNKWEAAWDRKERQNANASLRDLEALISLRCLEIDIDDPAAQNVHLSSKLERFHIRFPGGYYNNRKMHLHLEKDTCAGDWIKMLLERDTEYLHLTGNGAYNVEFAKSENIRWLDLGDRKTMKNIERTSMDDDGIYGGASMFPPIEHLSIFSLPELKEIWGGPIPSSSYQNLKKLSLGDLPTLKHFCNNDISVFTNLSSIEIRHCPRLRNLGQLSIAAHDWLAHIQILSIVECEMMEQVFLCKEEDNQTDIDTTIVFSELKSLILKSLPNLSSLCKGIESFEFPQITQTQVKDCPLLMDKVFSMNLFFEPDNVKMDIWRNQPFRNAEYLSLEGNADRNLDFRVVQNMPLLTLQEWLRGKKLVNVTTMYALFPHLEVLRLVKLTELEEIWDIDGPIQSHSFENFKELRLEFLPKLKHLWQGSSSPSEMSVVSIFSKLSSLYIYGCHELSNLFPLSVTFTSSCILQLEELVIQSCDRMEQVFIWNEGEGLSNIHIPKLKVLILDSLPKLTSFCKGTESFEFPLLDRKRISRCPLLENFVCTDWAPEDHIDDNTDLFCKLDNKENMKLKLQGNMSLGRNRIQECVEYMSLDGDGSTSSDFVVALSMRCLTFRECSMGTKLMNMTTIATLFPYIKVLALRECFMGTKFKNMTTIATPFPLVEVLCLVNITELEEIWDIDGPKNLNELRLQSLPALKHLWQSSSSPSKMNVDISILNKLSHIYIYGCHRLCNLFALSMMGKGSCLLRLETLVIESCYEMEQVFPCNEEDNQRNIDTILVFPELKSISLKSLPKLTTLSKGIESFEFPQLAQIQVRDCPQLKENVFPMNLFFEPDKVKMEIWNNESYRNAEYLSLEGNAYRNLDVRKVQNMRWLIFREPLSGTKLVSVTTMDTLFPQLEGLRLVKLPELEEIWEIDGTNSFQNLKELRLEFLPSLKHLWPSQVVSIFNKLSNIYIYGCHKLCNLFSLPVTETNSYLLQLEELVIESCDMIEYVFFWNEGENQSNIHIPKLKILILDSLPKLRSFCKGDTKIEFPLLDRKRISRCPLLENFVSIDWPPDDDGHNIHLFCELDNEVEEKMELKLQGNITLGRNRIQECVQYMSVDDETSFHFGVAESMRCLTFREFPMGTKLMNMETIATLFSCIKVLTFTDCSMENLMNMTTIDTPFPLLEALCLVNIKELVEIWDIDGPQHLNELRLKSLPALKHLWQISGSPSQMNVVSLFDKLSCIYIYECHRLRTLFSLPMMPSGSCLLQLETLVIGNCEMMEQVFLWNEEENRMNIHIPLVFPKLKVLKLDSLPKLMSFCDGTESFKFPLLVEMRISRCPLLQNLVHDADSAHLFCKPHKALKHLWKIRSGLYQMNVVSIFNQISSICIYGCDGLLHLFSLSMMVKGSCPLQLERLEIENCKEMAQVFLWNEEKNIHVHEFPKLKFLSLSFLPKLRNICKGVEHIQCPQLDKMKIINCPLLESLVYWDKDQLPFIFNRLRSPQLQKGKGANTSLQPQMLRIEEKQRKKETGEQRKTATEDEEEGRNGEIEEEQNWKSTTEKKGRKSEIEEEQNWKTTTKGGRKCEIEEEQN